MGPPCEHGGRHWARTFSTAACRLQWGRRVNTAEGILKAYQPMQNALRFNGAAV